MSQSNKKSRLVGEQKYLPSLFAAGSNRSPCDEPFSDRHIKVNALMAKLRSGTRFGHTLIFLCRFIHILHLDEKPGFLQITQRAGLCFKFGETRFLCAC
ncbi:MAG: hypothetical protein AAFV71_01850 [Cyanobacteria bacterium J06633_8]